MWTKATRGRLAAIVKKTKRYPTDLTDAEWKHIKPLETHQAVIAEGT